MSFLILSLFIHIWAPEWRSGLRHCISARGVTPDPGLFPVCITTGRDWESHRAAHKWLIVRVWPG